MTRTGGLAESRPEVDLPEVDAPGPDARGAGVSGAGVSGAAVSGAAVSGAGGSSGASGGAADAGMSDAELAGRLRLTVGLLVRRLRQRDRVHLSPAQLSALVTIEAAGSVRSGDLAARENVSAPTITRMVGAMEEAGLVTRRPDPSDARGSLVSLAPGGSAALDALRRERNNVLSRTLSRLPDDQRTALVAALPALEALLADLDD